MLRMVDVGAKVVGIFNAVKSTGNASRVLSKSLDTQLLHAAHSIKA